MNLDESYRVLGLKPGVSMEEARRVLLLLELSWWLSRPELPERGEKQKPAVLLRRVREINFILEQRRRKLRA